MQSAAESLLLLQPPQPETTRPAGTNWRGFSLAPIRNLSRNRLNAGQYALANFPPHPIPFQASRLHPALPACARRETAFGPD